MQLIGRGESRRLPKRFPVGTTYVVEGCGGENGNLCVFFRYLVLPNGQRINLSSDLTTAPVPGPRRSRAKKEAATKRSAAKRRLGPNRSRSRSRQGSRTKKALVG